MIIIRLDPEDSRILAWVTAMAHLRGGGLKVSYGSGLFRWLRNQLLMGEDYSCEGADFHDDPELDLPEGEVWDDRGKKRHYPLMFFEFFIYLIFIFVVLR